MAIGSLGLICSSLFHTRRSTPRTELAEEAASPYRTKNANVRSATQELDAPPPLLPPKAGVITTSAAIGKSPPTGANSLSDGSFHLPRETDDLTEKDFIKKFKDSDIALLTEGKPRTDFNGVRSGDLFLLNQAALIETNRSGELQFRRSISAGAEYTLKPTSCVSVRGSDHALVIGTAEDGNLTVRDGPIPHSMVLAISEKHYFLTYRDWVAEEEHSKNIPTELSMEGVILYFKRRADGKIIYQGKAVGSDHDEGSSAVYLDYCRKSFSDGGSEP